MILFDFESLKPLGLHEHDLGFRFGRGDLNYAVRLLLNSVFDGFLSGLISSLGKMKSKIPHAPNGWGTPSKEGTSG